MTIISYIIAGIYLAVVIATVVAHTVELVKVRKSPKTLVRLSNEVPKWNRRADVVDLVVLFILLLTVTAYPNVMTIAATITLVVAVVYFTVLHWAINRKYGG